MSEQRASKKLDFQAFVARLQDAGWESVHDAQWDGAQNLYNEWFDSESRSGGNPGEKSGSRRSDNPGIASARTAAAYPLDSCVETTADLGAAQRADGNAESTRDSADRRSPGGNIGTPSLDESNQQHRSSKEKVLATLLERLHADGGRYLISVALTREERDGPEQPTFGGKGFTRWLTEEEYDALVNVIILTPAEIQSNYNRVQWAEGLIRQLPETHEGRNSWLLNYGAAQP